MPFLLTAIYLFRKLMALIASGDTYSKHEVDALAETALWHLAFFSRLAVHSRAIPPLLETSAKNNVAAAVIYSASVLEALAYSQAEGGVHHLVQTLPHANNDLGTAEEECGQPRCWLDVFSARVRNHAEQLLSPNQDHAALLTTLLEETQQQHHHVFPTTSAATIRSTLACCDALLAALAVDYLTHTSLETSVSCQSNPHTSLFQFAPLLSTSSAAERNTSTWQKQQQQQQRLQQQQWYEARLYAALACATSLSTPGPLARLLVAYAHAGDGRLQAVVDENVLTHLRVVKTASQDDEEKMQRHSFGDPSAAAQARVRLSGLVAGVLEYTLYVAHIRSSVAVAALHAATAPAALSSHHLSVRKRHIGFSSVSQSAVLLLLQLTEECGYYEQTSEAAAPAAAETSAAASAAAIVHAVQELLFTIVLGGGTQDMPNRPEPVVRNKPSTAAEAFTSSIGASAAPAAATVSLAVTTTRGVSLPEADAITQELFPFLVQQLGMEWVWSPLLRHLSSLDKQLQPSSSNIASGGMSGAANTAASGGVAATIVPAASPPSLARSPVRWSSSLLMDTVLLAVAHKSYPQRLLNILPGSYERYLENLNLLPTMRPPGDDDGPADAAASTAGNATRAALFDMPAYYAEPASALVSYFQRAGVSGLRLEEVSRLLSTVTGSYAMLVRLKAQAPPLTDAAANSDEEELADLDDFANSERQKQSSKRGTTVSARHTYALSQERVKHLLSRYQGEVLLAAVVVYTQLRIPSQVQQLMRALAPLFLQIHLDWLSHHNGSIASWFLQQSNASSNAMSGVRFSSEAAVLLDKVGYEFYPLEWLPAVASSVRAAPVSSLSSGGHSSTSSSFDLPYSLFAAVGHQFRLQLRGTPLGGSGDATLRHPAGPRSTVVMPAVDATSLLSSREGGSGGETAAAWRRAERFFTGLMQVCYLDPKTSSTELEGTLAVSSTRRVLTAGEGLSQGSYGVGGGSVGGASLVAASAIASQRLHSLLQQPAVMDAMWGSMEQTHGRHDAARSGARGFRRHAQQHGQKRSRAALSPETECAEAAQHLSAMCQLLLDYGASSFDTTVEAADFALAVAQGFLPSTAGMSSASPDSTGSTPGKRSDALLQSALEWSRAAMGSPASRAKINMLLQQQQRQSTSATPTSASLARAYNSATVDAAWLARRTLRHVPHRIWEKIEVQQSQAYALAQREARWLSRVPGASAANVHKNGEEKAAARPRVDPLLLGQWTQWVWIWQQLGLAEEKMSGSDSWEASLFPSAAPQTAEEISCAQWLWYSPYFSAEWSN